MSETEAITNPLGTEKIGRLMAKYAIPSIIALVVNSLYNMVDQIFIGNAITVAVAFGVISTIICEILLELLCWMFGATEESIPYCLAYGRTIVLGFTFIAIAGSFTSIIRADGRAQMGMIGMFIGCIVNMILDPIFIFVFKWGVAGAAWATFIGSC